MKKSYAEQNVKYNFSRRRFIRTIGTTTAGLLFAPYISSSNILAYGHQERTAALSKVGITKADSYDRVLIKQKVQHLFESIGGISDVVKTGDKVAIKINLTGGSNSSRDPKLKGKPITETMWTHPEVVRAVGELLIDSGVNGADIYIVEALWDDASYNNFGFKEVQNSLGAKLVNLNNKEPYSDFIDKEVGENKFYYNSFKFNKILTDVDVYVSIPKMKQHYDAGVTHSIKNQIGVVPMQYYVLPTQQGYRAALHVDGGNIRTHLPRSICDLFFARPVNLAVIDGIKNAVGGEGVWNPTFVPAEFNMMIAGKDPVAADSVASYIMGNDPEADKFQLPGGEECDNYLMLLASKGMGTNLMSEIEIVGDGADLVTAVKPEYQVIIPEDIQLFQNFPNPFNPATTIKFYLPSSEYVSIKVFNIAGQEVETLVDGNVPKGQHELQWTPENISSGVYIYRMQAGKYSESKKLIYQK